MIRRAGRTGFAFVKSIYARAHRSRLQMLAAGLAYYAAFSLGPLLLLLGGWLGVALRRRPELADDYRNALTDLVGQALPLQVDAADLVTSSFDLVVNELGQGAVLRTIVSLAVLVWASGNFFTSLQHALEVLFEVSEKRTFWRKRLVAMALVGSVAAVIGVEVIGDALLTALRQFGDQAQQWFITRGIGLPQPLVDFEPLAGVRQVRVVITITAFTLAFRYLPRRVSTWWGALAGATASALGIGVMRELLVVTFNPERFNLIYGFITSLLAILLWLYLALLLFLVGAAIAAEVSARQLDKRAEAVSAASRDLPEALE